DLMVSGFGINAAGDVSFNGTGGVAIGGGTSVIGATVRVGAGGTVTLNGAVFDALAMLVSAPSLDANTTVVRAAAGAFLGAGVNLSGDLTVVGGRASTVTFGGSVTGPGNLTVGGGTVVFGGN